MSRINESDEELARRLQNEENQRSRQSNSSYVMNTNNISTNLASIHKPNVQIQRQAHIGERLIIKLHHPFTNNVIGEVMYVIYESSSVVVFELVSAPGRRLRVCNNGSVEFSDINDDSVRFQVELISNGATFLLNRANTTKSNTIQEIGWYLSLTREGVLRGNGGKNKDSQWILHGVDTVQSRFIPPQIPQQMPHNSNSNNNINNAIQSKNNVVTTGTVLSSSTKISSKDDALISGDPSKLCNFNNTIQWQWLESPIGQEYLSSVSPKAMSMFQDGINSLFLFLLFMFLYSLFQAHCVDIYIVLIGLMLHQGIMICHGNYQFSIVMNQIDIFHCIIKMSFLVMDSLYYQILYHYH